MAFDVAYSLYSFCSGRLPDTWRDYRRLVQAWLPGMRAPRCFALQPAFLNKARQILPPPHTHTH
jgi:hypothetical protein